MSESIIKFPKRAIRRYVERDGSIWEIQPDGWHLLIKGAKCPPK